MLDCASGAIDISGSHGARVKKGGRRGFTLVELMLGMSMLAIIVGALAGITRAVGDGWQATENAQALQVSARQTGMQLYKTLSSAKHVGLAVDDGWIVDSVGQKVASTGAAAQLLFWKNDSLAAADTMQAGELALLEHDVANKRLVLYELGSGASSTTKLKNYTPLTISRSTDALMFKFLPGMTSKVLATGVKSAAFDVVYRGSSHQRQVVDYVLTFDRGGQVQTEYGTVTLRGPITPN